MSKFSGNTEDASAPILGAGFWKKGAQLIGTVVRNFVTTNGKCYTISLKKPIKVDLGTCYPKGSGVEEMEQVSVGALKGFGMALQASGIPNAELLAGDMVQITCTGATKTDKGNDQINFDIQVDRPDGKAASAF